MNLSRVVILGLLAERGPMHGHQLRRAVALTNAEDWAGITGSARLTRFWTSTWARSESVPGLNVTVSAYVPSLVQRCGDPFKAWCGSRPAEDLAFQPPDATAKYLASFAACRQRMLERGEQRHRRQFARKHRRGS